MIVDAITWAREVGITNINIDMMYGIDGQHMNDLKKDIDMFLKLDVTHVSFYSLIIEPHTKLYIDSYNEIDEGLNAKMYDYINNTLTQNNYQHYEISNYAKEGYESKHNLVYWHNDEYYGFGLGASSFAGRHRFDNTKSLNNYIKGKYNIDGHILDDKEMMENEMILGLRLISGVNKDQFYQKYHKKIEDVFLLDRLIANGLLVDKNNFLYIPESKLFVSNSILLEFLD
jgi:oxygen-independent coproporphyrinogen-3 oxidase